MGINLPQSLKTQLQSNFKLKWNSTALTYLGTIIPSHISKVFDLNSPLLLTRVRMLLNKWNSGLHSWFSRCNILKMIILPKLRYLPQV